VWCLSQMFPRNRVKSARTWTGSINEKTAPAPSMSVALRFRHSLYSCVLLFAIPLAFIQLGLYYFSLGKPYQEVTFPGTKHPTVEIRYSGWTDQQARVFIVGPIYRQRILDIPWATTYRTPTNPPTQWGTGKVRMAMAHFDPYGIHWNKGGSGLAVSIDNKYVAAYDLNTGAKIDQHQEWVNQAIMDFMDKK